MGNTVAYTHLNDRTNLGAEVEVEESGVRYFLEGQDLDKRKYIEREDAHTLAAIAAASNSWRS